MSLPKQLAIVGSERKDNDKGPWLVVSYLSPKGEVWTKNIFGDLVADFKGNGMYAVTWEPYEWKGKTGHNIASLTPINIKLPLQQTPPAKTADKAPAGKPSNNTNPDSDGLDVEFKIAALNAAVETFKESGVEITKTLGNVKTAYLTYLGWLRGIVPEDDAKGDAQEPNEELPY